MTSWCITLGYIQRLDFSNLLHLSLKFLFVLWSTDVEHQLKFFPSSEENLNQEEYAVFWLSFWDTNKLLLLRKTVLKEDVKGRKGDEFCWKRYQTMPRRGMLLFGSCTDKTTQTIQLGDDSNYSNPSVCCDFTGRPFPTGPNWSALLYSLFAETEMDSQQPLTSTVMQGLSSSDHSAGSP